MAKLKKDTKAPKTRKRADKEKLSAGRPKKFTPEFIEKEAKEFEKWMQKPESLWYKDFALERNLDPDLFSIWAKENESFSGVYKRAQIWQQSKLVNGGLTTTLNPSFTKFVMANTCGWSERTHQTVAGDAENPLSFALNASDGKTKSIVNDD